MNKLPLSLSKRNNITYNVTNYNMRTIRVKFRCVKSFTVNSKIIVFVKVFISNVKDFQILKVQINTYHRFG